MTRLYLVAGLLTTLGCVRSVSPLPVEEGGFITGTVVSRGRETGTLEEVAGARVTALGTSWSVTTDRDGHFELSRLPLGVYDLVFEVRARGAVDPLARRIGGVRIQAQGQSVDLGFVRLGGLAEIEGAIALADVTAAGAAEGTIIVLAASAYSGVVGRDDRYTIGGIPPGPYEVAAYRAGYVPVRIEGTELDVGITSQLTDLTLHPVDPNAVYEVIGRVAVSSGDDEGVECLFISETTTASVGDRVTTRSDAEGRYEAKLPAGLYRARFSKAGHRDAEIANVVVTADGVLGLAPIVLGATREGDFDADGSPDATDDDDDGDGCLDDEDAFDADAFRCFDLDVDGLADEDDPDMDGDGLTNVEERSVGRDGWITSPTKPDTDDDTLDDPDDNCPLLRTDEQAPDEDGDGFGDPCDRDDTPVTPGGTPSISTFRPATQARGLPLTFEGANLLGVVGVEFTGGDFSRAFRVNEGAFEVVVPPSATDGQLTIFFVGGVSIVTTGALTIPPGPVVTSFSPTRASRGDSVTVVGTDLESLTDVWVGGERVAVTGMDAMTRSFVVPAAVSDGPQVIEYGAPGRVAAPGVLTIVSDPVIDQVVPNPVPTGAYITIFGRGLSDERVTDPVYVDFGSVTAMASSVSNTVVEVQVPVGLSGAVPITLRRGGRTSPPLTLAVDDGAVAITDVNPGIVFEGETFTILGANFDDPPAFVLDSVRVGGHAATVIASTPSSIDVVMPDDPVSAEIEITVLVAGQPETATYLRGPTVVRETGTTADVPCGIAEGDVLITQPQFGMLRTYQYPYVNPSTIYPPASTGHQCETLRVAPNERVAVSLGPGQRMSVFQLPSMTGIGEPCGIVPHRFRVAFDSTSRFAYVVGYESTNNRSFVIRIALATGACDTLGDFTGRPEDLVMRPGRNDRELVIVGSGGTYVVDAVSGAVLAHSPLVSTSVATDPNARDVWLDGLRTLRTPGDDRVLATSNPPTSDMQRASQSANLRYVFSRFGIHDLVTRRHVQAPMDNASHSSLSFRAPNGNTAFIARDGGSTVLMEIIMAPPM